MKYLIASDYPFDWFTSPFIYVKRMKTLLKYSPTHLHIQELNEGSTNLTDFTCATNVTITINSLLSQKQSLLLPATVKNLCFVENNYYYGGFGCSNGSKWNYLTINWDCFIGNLKNIELVKFRNNVTDPIPDVILKSAQTKGIQITWSN